MDSSLDGETDIRPNESSGKQCSVHCRIDELISLSRFANSQIGELLGPLLDILHREQYPSLHQYQATCIHAERLRCMASQTSNFNALGVQDDPSRNAGQVAVGGVQGPRVDSR